MTIESPAFANAADTYGFEVLRRAFGTSFQRGSGIGSIVGGRVNATDCLVTYSGSGLKVVVGTGEIWIPGSSTVTQGGYYSRVSVAETLTCAAANGSFPRIERVVAVVKDKAYSGTEDTCTLKLVEGTAESSATLANLKGVGAAPASSLTVGYVEVPAGATTLTAGEYPTGNFLNPPAVLTGNLPQMVIASHSASFTAASGELVKATAAITVTLPAPAADVILGVLANGNAVTVKQHGSEKIYEPNQEAGANSLSLAGQQKVLLMSDGTSWWVVAGEAKSELTATAFGTITFSPGSPTTEQEPSATHRVHVSAVVIFPKLAPTIEVKITVAGKELLLPLTVEENRYQPISFVTQPGQKWKAVAAGGAGTYGIYGMYFPM